MNFNIDFNFTNADTTYLTHSLHPYPAKFPPQLPHTIIKNFAPENATILDPFCGSGTIILSKVKATPLTSQEQIQIKSFLETLSIENQNWKQTRPSSIVVKQIEGLDHWFQHNVAQELTHILNLIAQEENQNISDFLKIVLSSIIVRVSNQEYTFCCKK